MADGTVYIDTEVNSDGFGVAFADYNDEIKNTASELDRLKREQAEVQESYDDVTKEVDRTSAALDKLIEKQIRFVETGGNIDSRTFTQMEYDIAKTNATLDVAKAKQQELGQSLTGLNSSVAATESYLQTLTAQEGAAANNASMLGNTIEYVKRAFKNFVPNIIHVGAQLPKVIGKGIINGFAKLGNAVKKVGSNLLNMGKSANKSRGTMTKMLGAALGIRSIYAVVSKAVNMVKEGMGNLAQYSSETNAELSLLKSSFTKLKNSLASAFAPILTVVTPIINSFIGKLTDVITYVGMFVASLTGKGTIAKAVDIQEDYAAGLNSTASAANKAEKALKGYLSPLDEISKYETNSTTGTSTSAGTVDPSKMFETVTIDSPVANLAEEFKKKINEGDWNGVGQLIGQKINSIVDKLDVSSLARKLSSAFAGMLDIITGVLEGIEWQQLGTKVTEFVANIDWSGVSDSFFRGIGAIFGGLAGFMVGLITPAWNSVVDWWGKNACEDGKFTINGLLNGILEGIKNIGKWIKEHIFTPFITGFKNAFGIHSPSKVMEEMGRYIIEGLLNGIKSVISKPTAIFTDLKDTIIKKWDETKSKTKSKWSEIASALKDKWNSITGNTESSGGKIVGATATAYNKVQSNTIGALSNLDRNSSSKWNGIFTATSQWASNIASNVGSSYNNLLSRVTGAMSNLNTNSFNEWRNVYLNTSDWVSYIYSSVVNGYNNAKNGVATAMWNMYYAIHSDWSNIAGNSSSWVSYIYSSVVNGYNNMKNGVVNVFWNLVGGIRNPINNIIGFINSMISGVVNGINSAIRALNGLRFSVPKWIPGIGGKTFGLNIGYVGAPQIPYLAQGAVIPPNAPFTAVLGDQRHGRNLELPEDLLRQIVREESGSGAAQYQFVAQINRRTLFDEFIEEAKMRQIQSGANPFRLA